MGIFKRSIVSLWSRVGHRAESGKQLECTLSREFPEITAWEKTAIATTRPHTMTSLERQWALISALKYADKKGLAGDVVECGVWKGGNLILAGLVGRQLGRRWKIWGYDTFEGMSEPMEFDVSNKDRVRAGTEFAQRQRDGYNNWCYSPIEEVSANIAQSGLDLSDYRLIRGKCEETLTRAENIPDKIAVLRLDTDWYLSTKMEIEVLYPRLTQQGVLIVDDYGHWGGATKAVDEYFKDQSILINRIDYTGRTILKV